MMDQSIRVYVDTCVFGEMFDEEFAVITQQFFDQAKQGRFSLVISATVVAEIREAPTRIKEFFDELMTDYLTIVPVSPSARLLQQSYINAGIVTAKYADDALHVAIATIVSWNFKHIVHFQKIPKYNAMNVVSGYRPINIYSPLARIIHDEAECRAY